MRGFSYPSWASVDEIQLGLFAWENSSNWTGRSIYLELPDLFRFIFPASLVTPRGSSTARVGW